MDTSYIPWQTERTWMERLFMILRNDIVRVFMLFVIIDGLALLTDEISPAVSMGFRAMSTVMAVLVIVAMAYLYGLGKPANYKLCDGEIIHVAGGFRDSDGNLNLLHLLGDDTKGEYIIIRSGDGVDISEIPIEVLLHGGTLEIRRRDHHGKRTFTILPHSINIIS